MIGLVLDTKPCFSLWPEGLQLCGKSCLGVPPRHEGLWAREVHEASRAVGGIEFVSFVAHTLCTPDPLWASVAGPAFAHFLEPYPDSMSSRLP